MHETSDLEAQRQRAVQLYEHTRDEPMDEPDRPGSGGDGGEGDVGDTMASDDRAST